MPSDNYHQLPGLNWSRLKYVLESPRAYRHAVDNPPSETPAMAFGTAVHMAVLEPERAAVELITAPPEYLTAAGRVPIQSLAALAVESRPVAVRYSGGAVISSTAARSGSSTAMCTAVPKAIAGVSDGGLSTAWRYARGLSSTYFSRDQFSPGRWW